MTNQVWIAQFPFLNQFTDVGLRHKFFGMPWEQPYKRHAVPMLTDEQFEIMRRYEMGMLVTRDELTEASAVYEPKFFKKQVGVSRARYCYIVDSDLAQVLAPFDLGPNGLMDYQIYEADEVTPLAERWQILGLGVRKKALAIDRCRNLDQLFDGGTEKDSYYSPKFSMVEGDLVLTPAALEGPDLWVDAELRASIFLSDRLGTALSDAGFTDTLNIWPVQVA